MNNPENGFLWNKGFDAGYSVRCREMAGPKEEKTLSLNDLKFLYETGIRFEEDITQ